MGGPGGCHTEVRGSGSPRGGAGVSGRSLVVEHEDQVVTPPEAAELLPLEAVFRQIPHPVAWGSWEKHRGRHSWSFWKEGAQSQVPDVLSSW